MMTDQFRTDNNKYKQHKLKNSKQHITN